MSEVCCKCQIHPQQLQKHTNCTIVYVSLKPEETGPHLAFNTVCTGLFKLVIVVYPQCTNTQNRHSLEVCVCMPLFQSQKKTGSAMPLFKFLPSGVALQLRLAKCGTASVCLQQQQNKKKFITFQIAIMT